jgi:hypothetical protein
MDRVLTTSKKAWSSADIPDEVRMSQALCVLQLLLDPDEVMSL